MGFSAQTLFAPRDAVKRAFDITFGLLAMPAVLPLMAVVALFILSGRDGPVLFRQTRVGRGRKPFTIFKFRSMRHRDPARIDQVRERVVSKSGDDRITPVGRVLRKTSLDELPQLFNVLNGTMSFVGPRPIIPDQLAAIPADRMDRFRVRPGITGWAQVNGRRDLDWPRQLELDSWYANHAGVALDILILLRTVGVVLRASGTYGGAGSNWRSYLPPALK